MQSNERELNEEMEFWLPSIKESIKTNGIINVYKRINQLHIDGAISNECFDLLIHFIDNKYCEDKPIKNMSKKKIINSSDINRGGSSGGCGCGSGHC